MDASKQAKMFIKALEQYADNEGMFYAVGFELGNLMSPRLDKRWQLAYDGYYKALEVGMRNEWN
jgi:hypothetical protein